MSGSETTVEFAVNLTCSSCVQKTENVLKDVPGISDFSIDLSKQAVIVTSSRPMSEVQALLESTGKRAVVLGTSGAAQSGEPRQKSLAGSLAAVAMLGGLVGAGNVQGVVRFVQVNPDVCVIDGTIDGLSPGEHALAIHECGDISGGCSSVGDHYNPRSTRHGSPVDGEVARHVGDLGNVVANDEGRATFRLTDKLVKVSDIIGRSIVVAAEKDDFGLGNSPLSLINGNCGQLLSCGIIARSSGLFENSKRFCACDGVTIWDERDKPLVGPGRQQN